MPKENYIYLHCKLLFSEVRCYNIFQWFILDFQSKIPERINTYSIAGFVYLHGYFRAQKLLATFLKE